MTHRDHRPAGLRGVMPVLVAVGRRPGLWRTAAAAVLITAVPGWWRRWPPLPLPDASWIGFRLECANGTRHGPLAPQDVVAWLEWCKGMPRSSR